MWMDAARWRALSLLPMSKMVASMACDPLPAALCEAGLGGSWSAHAQLALPHERPGSLLSRAVWFPNGISAVAVYGCSDALGAQWSDKVSGPWELCLGIAARVGDEASSEMLACFARSEGWPSLSADPLAFGEDGPTVDLGARAAFVEVREPKDAIEALRLLGAMDPAWDDPAQAPMWEAVREGRGAELAALLRADPRWAWTPWSRGSSLGSLCARLGRWGCLAACVEHGGRAGEEAAAGLSRALAGFCSDASPSWPLGAAPKALARAMDAGANLGPHAWSSSFGASRAAVSAAALSWSNAEAACMARAAPESARSGSKRV